MKKFDRIVSNPAILGGQPIIRGLRLSVRRVVEAVAIYPDWDELRKEYPELEVEVERYPGERWSLPCRVQPRRRGFASMIVQGRQERLARATRQLKGRRERRLEEIWGHDYRQMMPSHLM